MKKILISLTLIALLSACTSSSVKDTVPPQAKDIAPVASGNVSQAITGSEALESKSTLSSGDGLSEIKKRYALKGLLLDGDKYLEGDQYALALKKFLEAYESSPKDPYIAEKIGDAYFEMHKYSLAYKYFERITTELTEVQKDKKIISLLYDTNLSVSGSLENINTAINSLSFSEDKKFYYTNSLTCIQDFHGCKQRFGDKIVAIGTGKLLPEMKNIDDALRAYSNFQVDDVSYKNALILGAFLKNKMYPLCIILGKQILTEKKDYKPVLEVIAESYYNMGDMPNAKNYLESFLKLEQNNKNATYLMGVVQNKLREFILSNIFLNRALELKYEPKINVERRLIYNYSELGQTDKMLAGLKDLIFNEKEFEKEDAYIAIYYHIINGQGDTAIKIAEHALKEYPDDGNIYGYIGWIYKDKNDLVSAEEYLKKGLEKTPASPLILLNMGQLAIKKEMLTESIVYFKKAIREDKGGEFGEQATKELETISSGAIQ